MFLELVAACPQGIMGHVFNKPLVCFHTEIILISAKICLSISKRLNPFVDNLLMRKIRPNGRIK